MWPAGPALGGCPAPLPPYRPLNRVPMAHLRDVAHTWGNLGASDTCPRKDGCHATRHSRHAAWRRVVPDSSPVARQRVTHTVLTGNLRDTPAHNALCVVDAVSMEFAVETRSEREADWASTQRSPPPPPTPTTHTRKKFIVASTLTPSGVVAFSSHCPPRCSRVLV